jgi:outer membrane autotransporter protein
LRGTAAEIGSATIQPSLDSLANLRRTSDGDFGHGVRVWLDGGWSRINTVALGAIDLKADAQGLTGGADIGVGAGRIGAAFGYRDADGHFGLGSKISGSATSFGLYAGFAWANGLYAQGTASHTLNFSFGDIQRPAAYGQSAHGEAKGRVWAAGGEIGWQVPLGRFSAGPFGAIDYANVEINSFDEAGASLSNAHYAPIDYQRVRYGGGVELRAELSQAVRPNIRLSYAREDESGDRSVTATLISAQHAMATQTIALPSTERERLVAGGGIDGSMGHWSYRFAAEGRFARGQDEARVGITLYTRM